MTIERMHYCDFIVYSKTHSQEHDQLTLLVAKISELKEVISVRL